ncbi:MAG: excinuclease ABC subunit UvrA, partial [Gammaproteobacteria bacterium]|nr:excinuclease ABC subunit UvrA [Gammaproteobacteria bacterium]
MAEDSIRVTGARQNNLRGFDICLPLHELIVVTGVSGSGKSSFAFDTVYSEGQRRYVETFSPYARQFLDRMDKPRAERIDGIPPAIAIDQTNPVRTSRSTVGTMTELNDHIKLLYARAAQLCCGGCGKPVQRDTAETVFHALMKAARAQSQRALITFPVIVPTNFTAQEVTDLLAKQGYTRIHSRRANSLQVLQDRVKLLESNRERILEALEAALRLGRGHVSVYLQDNGERDPSPHRFSTDLHCADCDIHYTDPSPNLFSFNSPVGACETCRGFGRTMGIDYTLVIPDERKTLAEGAVKPWQSSSYRECHDDLLRFARRRGVPTDVPYAKLDAQLKRWVLEGEGNWEDGYWYGVQGFFDWLESRSYKMHIRVLLSKYRAYEPCPTCRGARLKTQALLWRLGSAPDAARVLAPKHRFIPSGINLSLSRQRALPGLCLHDLMLLPLAECRSFFAHLHLPAPLDQASDLLLSEIRSRLDYLVEVGLGYLTLDRQSRTLSGGEVQRINLTTALGTSLVNTLFVLDEPSIGLHPRDIQRLVNVLHRLRDAGNSLLVVEHDPQVMLAADRVVDLGPGPGEQGGRLVFFGTPKELAGAKRSLTADYLSGRRQINARAPMKPVAAGAPHLRLRGAAEHNLKGIDVDLPLNRLVCVTGVSGSGKSTLVRDILYHALRKLKGRPGEGAGRYRRILGHEQVEDVVLVDQSPIGKTTRSNPASYVGALDAVRKAYASQPLAQERGYTAGTFSFNSGNGRCPACSGNGFEHVEMQFLSDIYLRCPDCDGRRYRKEVLEVRLYPAKGSPGLSIADTLDMTVSEALDAFSDRPDVVRTLAPLMSVGLGYLKLGQPVPTLSGGEAQRLKLAGHLAKSPLQSKGKGGVLFLLDEPTTGLHFADVDTLLRAFQALLDEGHSLVVIEHHLDVIRSADWIIDLGPEGGDAGGAVVCAGPPEAVAAHQASHTGAALRGYQAARAGPAPPARTVAPGPPEIRIHQAREHNLKNVDISVPRGRFTVITGISGSGKSTVAFDIMFAEGQRRYLESLNAYARQFVQPATRPDVDTILGIPPTVAIEQRTSRGGRKSTVATLTEIYHFLRLLFVKLGTQYCPDCDIAVELQDPA